MAAPSASAEWAVEAYSAQTAAILAALLKAVRHLLGRFHGWYDTAEITRVSLLLARHAEAAQRLTASATDAYLAAVTRGLTGKGRVVGTIDVTDLRQGVTHAGAYGRAADQYRWRVSEGDSPAEAVEKAVERAVQVAETDVGLAARAQAQRFLVVNRAEGYRRVLRPELSKGGPCGLCAVASDRLYKRGDLLPIHTGCRCVVLPVFAGKPDVGHEMNRVDLAAVYEAAGGTGAQQLHRMKVTVHEHGEIGPVLTAKGSEFRTAADAERDTRPAA